MKINFASPNYVEKDFTVAASPSWQGVTTQQKLIEQDGQQILVEQLNDDMSPFFDFETLLGVAKQCGDLGIGLKVVDADSSSKQFASEYSAQNWRVAGLHDFHNEEIRKNILLRKKQLQSELNITHRHSTFELIEALSEQIKNDVVLCPKKIVEWQQFAQQAKKKLHDRDFQLLPCHLDGNISNILVNDQNEVKFSHFGLTALSDPLQDVGCYLMEAYELKEDAKQGYIEWFGEFNAENFEMAWLYGMLDDLKWGLIAINLSSLSPRRHLEFGKYASWRFLRFVENLKDMDTV